MPSAKSVRGRRPFSAIGRLGLSLVALAMILCTAPAGLANVVVYEAMGPANTWEGWGGWFGNGPTASMSLAVKFSPSASGTFEELYASFVPDSETSDRSYTIRLLADDGNSPGAVLWEKTESTWPVADGAVFHLDGLNGPMLTVGQSYWIQATKPDLGITQHGWQQNDQGYLGTVAISQNGDPWMIFSDTDVYAMRILTAPEPGTLGLLALGGLALVRRRRRV
ncbi:MAG: hypothetical protein BIFFINMI_01215 [Phycisphaerae bacterium]|nr:hypothetical protein [Phycisphaerae bacterium]